MPRQTVPVVEAYYKQLENWAHRIHMATITMRDSDIADVVQEIRSFYWITEGDSLDDKIDRL